MAHHDDAYDDIDARPSKTQLKKESHEIQALGEALLKLPDDRLNGLGLPDRLHTAVRDCRKMKLNEGRRRQLQYIGKLMRGVDVEPIREELAAFELGMAKDALTLHEAEAWRERLIHEDQALPEFIEAVPGVDIQQLRSLVRAARKDATAAPEQRHGRAYRELLQLVKAVLLALRRQGADGSAEDAP